MSILLLQLLPATFLLAAPGAQGAVDWQKRVVTARAVGVPDLNASSVAVGRLAAERAAHAAALRILLEVLAATEVASGADLAAMLRSDGALRAKVEASLRGFRVVRPRYFTDGAVALEVEADLDALPAEISRLLQPPGAAAPPAPPQASLEPSGIILDARAVQGPLAKAPRVLDEAGAQIYGPDSVNADKLQIAGVAGYAGFATTVDDARRDPRLGARPRVVVALRSSAGGGDVVVSKANADALRSAHQALAQGRVIFVLP